MFILAGYVLLNLEQKELSKITHTYTIVDGI
jgi:hypothetical protein